MCEYDKMVQAFELAPSFDYLKDKDNPTHIGYQYREFDSFWTILKSDSFWATDARFSNDSQEQRFGTDTLTCELGEKLRKGLELNEDYIVCFCAEDDKLSQWRGYAAKGGVSMGFDFGGAVPFYIPLAEQDLKDDMPEDGYRKVFVQSGWVCYLDPDEDSSTRRERISSLELPKGPLDDAIREEYLDNLKTAAPFIKHNGFQEENEWRLVFHNEDCSLSSCVRYRGPDAQGAMCPYIESRPGNPEYNKRPCVVRLYVDEKISTELLTCLREELDSTDDMDGVVVDSCRPADGSRDKLEDFCFGCTRRRFTKREKLCRCHVDKPDYQLYVRADENSIIISQGKNQEKVFRLIHDCVANFLEEKRDEMTGECVEEIPVWCEGHLPLRSLTVGPCIRQKEVMESIQHYCKHVYWLSDVKITASKIPFRRST